MQSKPQPPDFVVFLNVEDFYISVDFTVSGRRWVPLAYV
jgi:hypothetical protein